MYIYIYKYLVGGFNPSEKILVSWDDYSQYTEQIKNVETTNQICVFWLKMRYLQIHWFLRQTQRSDSWLYIPAKSHCGCLMPMFVIFNISLYSIILNHPDNIPHTFMVICSVISPYIPMIHHDTNFLDYCGRLMLFSQANPYQAS